MITGQGSHNNDISWPEIRPTHTAQKQNHLKLGTKESNFNGHTWTYKINYENQMIKHNYLVRIPAHNQVNTEMTVALLLVQTYPAASGRQMA